MTENKLGEVILPYMSGVINAYLIISAILFIAYLLAPIFGGKLLSRALVLSGSWIGIALTLKVHISSVKRKIPLKPYVFLFLLFYIIVCMFLWFPYPYNIFFCIFVSIANIFGYKKQLKSWKS